MAISMSPGIIAAVCILSVELVVIIGVIAYLLWRNHGPKNKSELPTGSFSPKVEERNEDECVVEVESEKVPAEETKTPAPMTSSPDEEDVNEESGSSYSSYESSEESDSWSENEEVEKVEKEEEENVDNPVMDSQPIDNVDPIEPPLEEGELPVVEEEIQQTEAAPVEEAPVPLSRHSSKKSIASFSSSSSSSSSNSESSCSSDEQVVLNDVAENEETREEVDIVDVPVENEPTITVAEDVPVSANIERNPSQASSTSAIEVGGIKLSLRIEPGTENSAPTLIVNGKPLGRGGSHASITSKTSSNEYGRSLRNLDADQSCDIQVIRKYDVPTEKPKNDFGDGDYFQYSASRKASDEDSGAPNSEEEDTVYMDCDEAVAGIINVTSGEKLTICQAVNKGLIPKKTALMLLEAQAATGSVVNPRNGVKFSVQSAVDLGIVDDSYRQTLIAAEGAFYGYMDPRTAETVCLSEAIRREIFPRAQGMRLLEAQVATGGIIDPWTGRRYPLDDAIAKGMIDRETAKQLRNPDELMDFYDPTTQKKLGYSDLLSKCIRDLDTGLKFLYVEEKPKIGNNRYQPDLLTFRSAFRRKVTLQDLMDAGLVEPGVLNAFQSGRMSKEELRDVLQPFLVGNDVVAGVLNTTTNSVLTICQAVTAGLLRRNTAVELLEAQAATGSIVDPISGKKMSVNRAISVGLVDRQFASALRKAEHAVHGYTDPGTNRTISLFEAMKKGIVIEIQGIRMLEAQLATGGIIDPEAGYRIPAAMALERGLFDHRMADILTNTHSDLKGYFDPTTGENTTYAELLRRCVRNLSKKGAGNTLLLPVQDMTPMAAAMQTGPYRHRKIIIMDPFTKQQLSVDQALSASVIDEETAQNLSMHEGSWVENGPK